MKKFFSKALIALAVCAAAVPGTSDAASQTFRYKNQTAYAYYSANDGCIATNAYVFTGESMTRSASDVYDGRGLSVYVSRYDFCSGTLLTAASGYISELPDDQQSLSRSLSTASVDATVPVFDYVSQTPMNIDVDLEWTGTGDVSRGNGHYHNNMNGFIINAHYTGASRAATVSGTINDGTTDYTSGSTGNGSLMFAQNGSVVVD